MLDSQYLTLADSSCAVAPALLIMDVGLRRASGEFLPVLESDWETPCHAFFSLATQAANQSLVLAVLYTRSPHGGVVAALGTLEISVASPSAVEEVVAEVLLGANDNGLYARAHDPRSATLLAIRWPPA